MLLSMGKLGFVRGVLNVADLQVENKQWMSRMLFRVGVVCKERCSLLVLLSACRKHCALFLSSSVVLIAITIFSLSVVFRLDACSFVYFLAPFAFFSGVVAVFFVSGFDSLFLRGENLACLSSSGPRRLP